LRLDSDQNLELQPDALPKTGAKPSSGESVWGDEGSYYRMLPISFQSALLAAVHDGSKTVTRRRLSSDLLPQQDSDGYRCHDLDEAGALFEDVRTHVLLPRLPCPFGQPGGLLQVQEDPTLVLQVINIRVEQVRDLTESDALVEGIRSRESSGHLQWGGVERAPAGSEGFCWYDSPREAFQALLDSIYPTAWSRNEWVWVVEFQPIPRR
jgi:hypothetical protein